MANAGNNAEGTNLISMEGRTFGIDAAGNLVLNSLSTDDTAPSRGVPGIIGKGIPFNLGITNGAGASANIANVLFQVQDVYGNAVAGVFNFDLWLSDAATGIGLTATTASGGIAAVTSDGTILGVLTTSKALRVSSNASGLFGLAITDTGKTLFYPVASILPGMPAVVGAQLTTGSYHS